MNFPWFLMVIYSILGNFTLDLISFIILVIIALIIVVLVKLFLVLIPAILIAIVVYFFTGDLLWTGIAFLIVAALSLLSKL